ncbi:NADPH-dependent aldehyde reductase Ahr [Pseudomarimonas salicorniae]|uniref:NAD(P)-dependent alcohol dehydrogenase n=1 Tax=Pseudomarimonas salicorniae TaxID=2933270 RepID=A0ABT0GIF6_9GAMM|nr:NAD(P)-dependent alcohol dehydrogenase [Lysobacter sp. CAU 1642]MCK7594223.1 NAD(P)-dependent alcohol dehydrogenase [Lysobacter sp. CAU 1642]
MAKVKAWAAPAAGKPLEHFEFDPGPLADGQVEVEVEYCGLCHSDLSLRDDEWGMTQFPFVPGHEAVGRVTALGEGVRGLEVGQRVGVGWNAHSCQHCGQCLDGKHNLCPSVQPTLVGRHGAFAQRVRVDALWAVPIPDGLDPAEVGPLLCGGITVFAPLREFGISPTARVGVVGIGGLGHLALKFARAWGCEVTAFTSSDSKADEARGFGAHRVVNSKDSKAIGKLAGQFDLILVTANASLDWDGLTAALAPNGRLHVVGAVLEPIPVQAFPLIMGQKSISGSPTGSRKAIDEMLAFAARHQILPKTEHFPMSKANEALEHLKAGKARYRVVLDADFS